MTQIKNCFFLISLLFLGFLTASAQTITGKIADTAAKKEIFNAVIVLLNPKDSGLYKFTRSNTNGEFEIKNVKPGKYIVMVSHPYYADYVDEINTTANSLPLAQIPLISKANYYRK